jgi:hypothetical protein
LIREQDSSNNEQQQKKEQQQQREFSSIFAFKIIRKGSSRSLPHLQNNKNIDSWNNLLASNRFKSESEAYESGFGKPIMFENNILVEPYYDIIEEQIIEDTTNKDKPGEIK